MTLDLASLRAAAEAATRPAGPYYLPTWNLDHRGWCPAAEWYDAQAFIAAADPQTVLALVRIAEAAVAYASDPEKWDYSELYDALRDAGVID